VSFNLHLDMRVSLSQDISPPVQERDKDIAGADNVCASSLSLKLIAYVSSYMDLQ